MDITSSPFFRYLLCAVTFPVGVGSGLLPKPMVIIPNDKTVCYDVSPMFDTHVSQGVSFNCDSAGTCFCRSGGTLVPLWLSFRD